MFTKLPKGDDLEQIFQQLDVCVQEERKAEQTGCWKKLEREARTLRRMVRFCDITQAVAHMLAIWACIWPQDWLREWIPIMLSATAFCGIVLRLRAQQ